MAKKNRPQAPAPLGCPSSKARHESEEEASRAAREGMLHGGAPPLAVYRCLVCMGWHLTSSVKPARKPKRRK